MKYISPTQSKMARAALDWSQGELASRARVAAQTVNRFENGEPSSNETIAKLAESIELAGVELLPGDGIVPRPKLVTVLEGPDSNERLLDDIYETLKDTGGEVMIAGLAEADPASALGQFVSSHVGRMQAVGISERILLEAGDQNLIAPREWYRWLPEGVFTGRPFQAYANKVALIDFGPPGEVVIIDSAKFAESFKALFDALWSLAAISSEDGNA